MLNAGEILSHFELIEPIGAGGMGAVWRARDRRLSRDVAIKVLPEAYAKDPRWRAGFEREARLLASLDHPGIVTIHSIERARGIWFITMELLRGRTLADEIRPGGRPLEHVLERAIPLADALGAAHDGGVVHGDLKPGNVFVTEDGRVKILDFGLARPIEAASRADDTQAPTRSGGFAGGFAGTLPYMSPEQVQGRPIDARSDLFSIGVILHELASGVRPFAGETPVALAAAILKDRAPSPDRHAGRIPEPLLPILAACLEKDPALRPASAARLRDELKSLRVPTSAPSHAAPRPAPTLPSIAVLPFADMSVEQDQGYFCEGIAEEILGTLSRVPGLRVATRASAFRLRGTDLDAREIGRRLRVDTLLEGSVRKAGDRLRIAVELSSAEAAYVLWSDRFDRDLRDVFAIQEEIALRIAERLRGRLTPSEAEAARRAAPRDVGAYDYYLRGRSHFERYARREIEIALRMFECAVALDGDYAPAHAGVSDCCSFLVLYAFGGAGQRERALAAARRAIALDPKLAQAHVSLGVALSLERRHDEAASEFEAALALDPDLFEAHYFYARDCFARGTPEDAVAHYRRASEVRPEDHQSPLLVAQILDDLGRPDEARAERERGIRLAEERIVANPDDGRAHYMMANALAALGRRDEALSWTRRALGLDPDDPMLLYNVACVEALAGRGDDALEHLERAVRGGLAQIEWLERDSNLDSIRSTPRFEALLAALGGAR